MPFLYQTRTIMRPSVNASNARADDADSHSAKANRHINNIFDRINARDSRSSMGGPSSGKVRDEVPFEGVRMEEGDRRPRSTITREEKEAFARLFNMVVTPDGEYKAKTVKSEKASQLSERKKYDFKDEDFPQHFPPPLKRIAKAASLKVQEKEEEARLYQELRAQEAYQEAKEKADAEALASNPLRQEQQAQIERIETLLYAARTDVELWNVLETELFTPLELLELDHQQSDPDQDVSPSNDGEPQPPATSGVHTLSKAPAERNVNPQVLAKGTTSTHESLEDSTRNHNISIITHIYPALLLSALNQLKDDFPSSTLPFTLLPRIKRLGRTSYILGASTPLYNTIIDLTHTTYADFHRIDEILHELDNSGLEFDSRTLEILEQIAREGEKGRKGRLGINEKQVWNMDLITDGWRKVVEWIPTVRERVEEEAARRAIELNERRQEAFAEGNIA